MVFSRLKRQLLLAFLLVSVNAFGNNFPRPAELEPAVRFWTNVYSKVSTNQGYVHDAVNLSVVYKTLDLPYNMGERQSMIDREKARVAQALRTLGSGKTANLDSTEQQVKSAWPKGTSAQVFRQAANEVRFQLGQSDRFKEGLIRSGQWKPHIRRVLAMHKLPEELMVLPHVESSFNPNAYSKVAAAGMWQFMPGTARQYMRVDSLIDERMDPFTATEGAAKLLQRNYTVTGSWPLALTAYNHGAGGIMRAANAVGSKDIATIVRQYRGPAFGFASRNFYASFLAALEVDRNAERYFGPVRLDSPTNYDTVVTGHYMPAAAIAAAAGVSVEELRLHNPAFRDRIWSGEKYIPRGYEIRVPRGMSKPLGQALAAVPQSSLFSYQKPDVTHRIRTGESLSAIASTYKTSVKELMALNGITNSHRIRAGQELILPGNVYADDESRAAVASTPVSAASTPSAAVPQPGEYVIQSGDSLWSIARRFNISQSDLVAWNSISNKNQIKPGDKLRIVGSGGPREYIIQSGDSLWSIARRFNLAQNDLLRWNKLSSGNVIRPGQVLRLAAN
jgi:peptidoglycan lytic transglycosylase D